MILTVYKVISDTPISKNAVPFHLKSHRYNTLYSKHSSAFKFLRAANNFDKFFAASIQLETRNTTKLYNGIIHYLSWEYGFTPYSKRFRKTMRSITHMDGSEFSRSGLVWISRFENARPLCEISRFSRRYYRSIE